MNQDDQADEVLLLKAEVAHLRECVSKNDDYYTSKHAETETLKGNISMPEEGWPARHAKRAIKDVHELDYQQRLNTSSYVNVAFEPEEYEVAKLGMAINLADQTVYPASFKLHDTCVNMVANLWHCPEPSDFAEKGVHAGAQTVGSTEACLLAGLCMKFRWRAWYAKKYGLSEAEVLAVRPNMVISTCFQAAWEKLFRYMDIEPKLVPTSYKTFSLTPESVCDAVDDKTIGVVCIMGDHYAGHYDPVLAIGKGLDALNEEKGFIVGIHVDAASGGFIAPYQKDLPDWDFNVPQVLSISASGHKFGLSVCGTGWVVWRERKGLSEHVAVSVSYLGGKGESYTLNFSRPASGVYVQFYKFLHLGRAGYEMLEHNTMANASYLRHELMKLMHNGMLRFEFLDNGDSHCLPVVAARLNPELNLPYTDVDLQHALAQDHWYVSAYHLSMNHPLTEKPQPLFFDADMGGTMFRVVVKSNLTRFLVSDLVECFVRALEGLDKHNHRDHPRLFKHRSSVC